MIKPLLLSLLVLILSYTGYAQSFPITSGGSQKNDEVFAMCRDAQDNIYLTGFIGEDLTVPGTATTVHCFGASDVFVAKIDANGAFVWLKNFGGSAPERGLDIDVDAGGNLYVTGFFYGIANFGGTILTSNASSQDAFILKLDNNGNTQWAYALGGPEGDLGNTIKVDNNGSIILGGQFKATADFNGLSATSTISSSNNTQFSFDAFVAKFNSSGNPLWLNTSTLSQGLDRTLSITTDANNNIYAVGQFSDTVNFGGVIHNNSSLNAGFLIKYNSAGNETYFSKLLGSQLTVSDLVVDASENVYVTGEYKGSFLSVINTNNTVSTLNHNYTYHSFVSKYNNTGVVQWQKAIGSNNLMGSKNITLDSANNVLIYGYYKCKLSEINDTTDENEFFSMGYSDLFIAKYDNQGNFNDIQNGGSKGNDVPAGILNTSTNKIQIAGSHDGGVSFPSSTVFSGFYSWPQASCYPANYYYYYQSDKKLKSDFFTGACVDFSAHFLDMFIRTDSSCVKNYIAPKIERQNTHDTLNICYSITNTNFLTVFDSTLERYYSYLSYDSFTGLCHETIENGNLSPLYNYKWNTGDTLFGINIHNTGGWYSVDITRKDGCISFTDSVFVIIHAPPTRPLISDSKGVNIFSAHPTIVRVCVPDTVMLTGTIDPLTVVDYAWNDYAIASNDSILTLSSTIADGSLNVFFVRDAFGCYNSDTIKVSFEDLPDTNTFKVVLSNAITLCEGDEFYVDIYDSLIPSSITHNHCFNYLQNSYAVTVNGSPAGGGSFPIDCILHNDPSFLYQPTSSGNHHFDFTLTYNNVCGIKSYNLQANTYVTLNPKPTLIFTPLDSIFSCPGDSVFLTENSNGIVSWGTVMGTGVIDTLSNAYNAYTTSEGTYSVSAVITNQATGCYSEQSDYFVIKYAAQPEIILMPSSGIICPNDSVKLTSEITGVSYEWHGPGGTINQNQQSIFASVLGQYYCVINDFSGCQRISKTVEIKEYITPSLSVIPDYVICNSGSSDLLVIAADSSIITWQSPLSGASPTQNVTSAGAYTVNVFSCNITTTLVANITVSSPVVNVSALNLIPLCYGDSVILYTNQSGVSYNWSDGSADSILIVTEPGIYTVNIMDQFLCLSNTDTIEVLQSPNYPTLTVPNDTIVCMNSNINLNATSSGTINWYYQDSGNLIYTGVNYIQNNLTDTLNLQIQAVGNAGCLSTFHNVAVNIFDNTIMPNIISDTLVCSGSNVSLTTTGATSNTQYHWSGPNNFSANTQNIQLSNFDSTKVGNYYLSFSAYGCNTDTAILTINQIAISNPILNGLQQLCGTDSAWYSIQNLDTSLIYSWNLPGNILASGDSVKYSSGISGTITCVANNAMCTSQTAHLSVVVSSFPSIDSTINSSPYCAGSSAYFGVIYSPNNATIAWTGPTQFSSNLSQDSITNADTTKTGYYTYTVTNSTCAIKDSIYIQIQNVSQNTLTGLINYCEGDTAQFILSNPDTSFNFYWSYNGLNYVGDTLLFPTSLATTSITYYSSNGLCHTPTQTQNIVVNEKPVATANIANFYCSTTNIFVPVYYAPSMATIQITGPQAFSNNVGNIYIPNSDINQSGTYYYTVTNSGCSINDSVTINIHQKPTATITGNTSYCEGDIITLYATSVDTSFHYNWSGIVNVSNTDTLIFNSTGYQSSTEVLSVTNQGCNATAYVSINIKPLPSPIFTGNMTYCINETANFDANTGVASTYSWTGPNGFSSNISNVNIPSVSTSNSGFYYLQTTFQGCSVNSEIWLSVFNPSFSLGEDVNICIGESLTLTGPSNYFNYTWNNGDVNSNITVDSAGIYILSANAMNNTCNYIDTIEITTHDCNIDLVNVVTPNGDGINDTFKINLKSGKLLSGQVYNRYGNLEFEFQENVLEWNCANRISNNIVSTGVYYYILKIEENGAQKVLKGYLHLYK